MFKRIIPALLFLLFAWLVLTNNDAKTIIAGIAIFLIGMHYMEDGFKLFSGGALEYVLSKFTSTTPRAIGTGFLATSVVQSSSLVSVIVISFLSAELIVLKSAIGVVFGSNIGTTTTAWLISSFGLKINIATYALPMLIFGVVLQFSKLQSYKGIGSILIGLGFIFLGIAYMKEGFETLKSGLDLSQFAMDGIVGILVYIILGALATVVIQSSSATMAIIITALASGQIDYINALSLAIGSNIGTTVTAILGAIASNKNGKRLAVAHLIFNMTTGLIAVVFIYQLKDLVDTLAPLLAIQADDYAMKLALFHTIFNVIGVIVMTPFTNKLVLFLQGLFQSSHKERGKPKYLTDEVMEIPASALAALRKETIHLYDKSLEAIVHAMNLHRSDIYSSAKAKSVVTSNSNIIEINIDKVYRDEIKQIYGAIIHYGSLSQRYMDKEDNRAIYELKIAARRVIEMVKDVRELQRNLKLYTVNKGPEITAQYNILRLQIIRILRRIDKMREMRRNGKDVESFIESTKENFAKREVKCNKATSELLSKGTIDPMLGASLINDIGFTFSICAKFLMVANQLWGTDDLSEDEQTDLVTNANNTHN